MPVLLSLLSEGKAPVADLPGYAESRVPCQTCGSDKNGCGLVTSEVPSGTWTRWVCQAAERLDRHAEANATLAGFVRRAFVRAVR